MNFQNTQSVSVCNFNAVTTANFIYNRIVCLFGTPKRILTDQGSNFEAELTQQLCQLLLINKVRSTAYHPATNGQVERMNKTLKQMLACVVNDNHTNWDMKLTPLLFAYNVSIHSATKFPPFEIVFGRKAPIVSIIQNNSSQSLHEYVREVVNNHNQMVLLVQNIAKNANVAKSK